MAGTTVVASPSGGHNIGNVDSVVHRLVTEHGNILTDLETLRVAVSAGGVTLVNELADDHATNKALLDEALSKLAYLVHRDQNRPVAGTNPVFAISTNFDVANTETCTFLAAGVPYTLGDNTVCDTGTAKTIAASQWAAFVIDASDATTLTGTWTATVASEALAIAAAKALPFVADTCRLGYVTVNAHASGFTAGTDALTGGAGGNVATATNYYQFFELAAVTATTSAATLSSSAASTTAVDAAGDLVAAAITLVPE